MLWKILVAVLAVVALFAAFVASRPSELRVERTAKIAAPPDAVYARLSDFGRWRAWSPWERLDPSMTRTVSGTPAAVGHAYAWAGNDEVGEGRMTITELAPGERVAIRLEFLRPWRATHAIDFSLVPDGAGSRVSWSMSGTNGFLMKAVGIFVDVDAMVGDDFERGLRNLAEVAERDAAPAPPAQVAP